MVKLPIYLSLEHKKILVVGGGNAALIKIKTQIGRASCRERV